MKLITYLLLLLFSTHVMSQITVGWGAECDFDMNQNSVNLQLAINSGAAEVRITNQNFYATSITIENQIILKGGYVSCDEAAVDNQTNINSVIDADGFGLHALKIKEIQEADVLIDSVTLLNGEDSGLQVVANDGLITLNKVQVLNSSGQSAGGIYVYNYQTAAEARMLNLVLNDTAVKNNESTYFGGGLACVSNGSSNVPIKLHFANGTLFQSNHANNRGGGIYLDECDLDYMAGNSSFAGQGHLEIYDNTATDSGGGLSIQTAEVNLLGDVMSAFEVSNNISGTLLEDNTSGGALFVVGSSEVTLINAHVLSNQAGRYGGGLYTSIGSQVLMDVANGGCHYDEYCSILQNNTVTGSFANGAAVAATDGEMTVNRTLIRLNKSSNYGYIAHARNDGLLTFEGNLIINNGAVDSETVFYGMHLQDQAVAQFFYNTEDRNLISGNLFRLQGAAEVFMYGNVIGNQADLMVSDNQARADINCNMIANVNNIGFAMTNTINDRAVFIEQSIFGNYRLDPSSTHAMDVCSDNPYTPGADLAGNFRGMDNQDVVNLAGLNDLGAYEVVPVIDVIFANSFE